MSLFSFSSSPTLLHRVALEKLARHVLAYEDRADALDDAAEVAFSKLGIPSQQARLALASALWRLVSRTSPIPPNTASVATRTSQAQYGALPVVCWNCDATTWWRAQITTARWLCARCSPPDHDDAIVWHDATTSELEDAKREPSWTETPDQDDYVLLRIRKLAREAARAAADLLGAWRPTKPRTSADLAVIDWHAITDASAIMAAAEELRAWAIDECTAARVIACRALAATIGWPVRAIAPVLDRALDLLRRLSGADAIAVLGSKWPADHAPGSVDPVLLRVDAVTEVYAPAHPHLHILLLGMKPARKALNR